jgi:ribonuclease HII
MNNIVIGVDEAGRGPLAGPLVVAGVFLDLHQQKQIQTLTFPIRDSKTLSQKQREHVYGYLEQSGILYTSVCIHVPEIDEYGIGLANTEGIKQVIKSLLPLPDRNEDSDFPLRERKGLLVVVDGYFPREKIAVDGVEVKTQVDADATVLPVILAGIVAKVTRDRMMKLFHEEYPAYGWEKNKGYGTKSHIQAIREQGSTKYHRRVFVETVLRRK